MNQHTVCHLAKKPSSLRKYEVLRIIHYKILLEIVQNTPKNGEKIVRSVEFTLVVGQMPSKTLNKTHSMLEKNYLELLLNKVISEVWPSRVYWTNLFDFVSHFWWFLTYFCNVFDGYSLKIHYSLKLDGFFVKWHTVQHTVWKNAQNQAAMKKSICSAKIGENH